MVSLSVGEQRAITLRGSHSLSNSPWMTLPSESSTRERNSAPSITLPAGREAFHITSIVMKEAYLLNEETAESCLQLCQARHFQHGQMLQCSAWRGFALPNVSEGEESA